MKIHLSKIMMTILVFFSFSCTEPRWFTVTTRFGIPVMNRPLSPGEGYLWIEGEWFWNGRSYTWRDGYWSMPLRGYRWMPGQWRERRDGWYWKPGRWKR